MTAIDFDEIFYQISRPYYLKCNYSGINSDCWLCVLLSLSLCLCVLAIFFSNFWDSYFSSYGEFGEFSLRFTAPLSGRSLSNKAAHHITAKIGDAGVHGKRLITLRLKYETQVFHGTLSEQRPATHVHR